MRFLLFYEQMVDDELKMQADKQQLIHKIDELKRKMLESLRESEEDKRLFDLKVGIERNGLQFL